MGSSGGSSTTVQKADPWKGQQPYLKNVFSEAQKLYESGNITGDYYPGGTVAPQSAWTQQALQMQADRALAGSASVDAAQQSVDAIVSGQSMAGNSGLSLLEALARTDLNAENAGLSTLTQMASGQDPYLEARYQDASREALSVLNGNFSRAGRYGSGAHAAAGADAAADLAAQMYGQAYQQQMQAAAQAASLYNAGVAQQAQAAQAAGQLYNAGVAQQLTGAGVAQQLAGQAYTDAAALSQAGAMQDSYAQSLLNADISRWNYEEQRALEALNRYNQLIQGDYGGVTTTTGQQNTGSTVLGGISAGATLGATLGGTPGSIIGAVGGGLLSLL